MAKPKTKSSAEIVADAIGWDVADVEDLRYQSTRSGHVSQPSVGDTATLTGPDGTTWQRVVTSVGAYDVYYTLTGPAGAAFEMRCQVDAWRIGIAGYTLGHTNTLGDVPCPTPRVYAWDDLVALALSVPAAEWRRSSKTGQRAELGSIYSRFYLDLYLGDTGPTLQVGSGPRSYTFQHNNLTRAQRDDLGRLADRVFAIGHDVAAKLTYIFDRDAKHPGGGT